MPKLKTGVFIATIIILFGVSSQVVQGDAQASGQWVVILADRQAVAESEGGVDIARSFVGLVSALGKGHFFGFVSADDPTHLVGPALAGDPEFGRFSDQVYADLASTEFARSPDFASALAETYNLLGNERAVSGSTVYLLTGGTSRVGLMPAAGRLEPLAALFEERGWSIVGLSLPGASPEVEEFLSKVSEDSGGESLSLSVPDGLKNLSDKILRDTASGSLTEMARGILTSDRVLTTTLGIAPGTREATMLFFKEGTYGSLRLSNPSGFEASIGDRTASSVVETPHLVMWKLVDPMPGEWRVEVRGIEGAVTAWQYVVNKYSVVLEPYGAIALNEPSTLVAFVTADGRKVALDGVVVVAKMTSPDGATLVYELNDDGASGDYVAGDGYFTATISPPASEGAHKVELELTWPEFGHKITSQASVTAQGFPEIDLVPVAAEDLRPDQRSRVATILVHIQGQPYAIPADALAPALSSNGGLGGIVEIRPQRFLDQGRAWSYDVFFTPLDEGHHTLIIRLDMEYADRLYTYSSEHVVLSSLVPVLPADPAVELAVVAPSVAPSVPSRRPDPAPLASPSGFAWGLLLIPFMVVAVGLAMAALYWLTQARPYGYLYNDRDEVVVDFAALRRQPIMGLLSRNTVRGWELGVAGLERVTLSFSRGRIRLRALHAKPTVRVNNQPLIGQTTLRDRTWIGTRGRLYSFWLSPPAPQAEPGLGDD